MREARPEIGSQADIIKPVATIKDIYTVSALDILPDDVLVIHQGFAGDLFLSAGRQVIFTSPCGNYFRKVFFFNNCQEIKARPQALGLFLEVKNIKSQKQARPLF